MPLPYTNNSSIVSGVTSICKESGPGIGSSSGNMMGSTDEHPSQVLINHKNLPASYRLHHSKSSMLANAPYPTDELATVPRTVTKKMIMTPSLAFHSKPQMIQPA